MNRLFALAVFALVFLPMCFAQAPVTVNLDSAEGLLIAAPGGFEQASYAFGLIPSGEGTNGQGLTITLNEGEGLILYGPSVNAGEGLVLIRCSVWSSGPDVFMTLVGLNAPVDGSLIANMPINGADYMSSWHTMEVLYDPRDNAVMPAFQVVATSPASSIVYLDQIVVTPLGVTSSVLEEMFAPTIAPTSTPTPTEPAIPTATPTSGEVTSIWTLGTNQMSGLEEIRVNIFGSATGAIPLDMVLIPAGTFMMGPSPYQQGTSGFWWPQHEVTISQPFFLGMFEITEAQWLAVMGSNPSVDSPESQQYGFPGCDNCPVNYVNWNDCQDFIERLNEMGRGTFRLPTEAEWEYACRAGTTTLFSFGDMLCEDTQNTYSCSEYMWWLMNSYSGPKPVANKRPNPWGLYDMHGNVEEWCSDWLGYYQYEPQIDPIGPIGDFQSPIPGGPYRVMRGGSWEYSSNNCQSAARGFSLPDGRTFLGSSHGLRLVRLYNGTLPPPLPTPTPAISTSESIVIDIPGLPSNAKPLEMVLIPAGTFMMGSPNNEQDRDSYEGPQHEVTISQPFFLGMFEITQAQWLAVMGSNPTSGDRVGDDYPVDTVSWDDCQTFISHLNGMGRGSFRLPSEAEWEYACRAGTMTRFYWGDDPSYSEIGRYAWYFGNKSPNGTKVVGQKLPNAWGLYDMSGNVEEWCGDFEGSYSSSHQTDPQGPIIGSYRIKRGGCWGGQAKYSRSAYRTFISPNARSRYDGVRLLRVAQ